MSPRASALQARARPGAAVGLVALALLSACAGPAESSGDPEPSPSLPSSIDAVSVTADVFRTRIDPSRGGIQLSVRNDGDAPLALVGARLSSPLLAAEAERDDEARIPPGGQRDLPLTLPAPVCPADLGELPADGEPVTPPTGVLLVPLADGTTVELQVTTTDRLGQWAEWYTATCVAQAVEARAALSVRVTDAPMPGVIGVELVIAPRPGSGAAAGGAGGDGAGLELESVAGTVLLGALGADGLPAQSIPLDVALTAEEQATEPIIVPLTFRPNRCDAHAIADDKQGTLFRVAVTIGGRAGTVTVIADDGAKDAIYASIASACSGG
jgi:hypothetical protein